jgi:hypothetical protein
MQFFCIYGNARLWQVMPKRIVELPNPFFFLLPADCAFVAGNKVVFVVSELS